MNGIKIKNQNKERESDESNKAKKQKYEDFTFSDFHKLFEVVFVDQSGYLNICSKMSRNTFLRVKYEANISLGLLGNNSFNSFVELFIKNHSIEMSFDALMR